MTTFGQKQFEELGLLEKKHTTTVRVSRTNTNHPDMLTNKELEEEMQVIVLSFWKDYTLDGL